MRDRVVGMIAAVALLGCVAVLAACGSSGKHAAKNLSPTTTTGTTTTASTGGGKFLGKGGEDGSAGDVPNYTPSGTLVSDDGFRPEKDGFAFENYTNDGNPQNLTPAAVAQLFGDQVCASGSGDSCQLTPPAQQWMDQSNDAMKGGHCEGFSVAAIRFYKGTLKADDFGGGDPFSFQLNGSLQSQIALGFVTQEFPSMLGAQVKGTPNQILDKLLETLKSKSEYYTLGIYKPDGQGGRTGGHAVTPYAVEDKGDGKMNVLIYDNNYPGKTRVIEFDRNADTWSYTAQTNPNNPSEEYKGDAQTNTIELDPESPTEGQQPCPFCNGQGGGGDSKGSAKGSALPSGQDYNELTLASGDTNHAHLLITDDQGQKTGYDGGHLVQEIPGVQLIEPKSDRDWEGSPEPIYHIPVGMKVTVTIDGSAMSAEDTESLELIGPGEDTGVQDIKMAPGQKDEVTFNGDGSGFSFRGDPNQSDAPVLIQGFTADSGDYAFGIHAMDLGGGSKIGLSLDKSAGQLKIDTTGTQGSGTYAVAVTRESGQGTQTFQHNNLSLNAGDMASLDYSAFTRSGEPIKLDITGAGGNRSEELQPSTG